MVTIVKPTPPSSAPGLNELTRKVLSTRPAQGRACISGEEAVSGKNLRPLAPCRVERLVETKQVLAFEDKADAIVKAEDKGLRRGGGMKTGTPQK